MENKSIELTSSQVKALQDGASSLIVPITENTPNIRWRVGKLDSPPIPHIEFNHLSIQVGDKYVFIKEDFFINGLNEYVFMADFTDIADKTLFEDTASKMTKEQSRLTIEEVIDVRVNRIWDLTDTECDNLSNFTYREKSFDDWYNNYIKELEEKHYQETNERIEMPKYENNPYVFLYGIKIEGE